MDLPLCLDDDVPREGNPSANTQLADCSAVWLSDWLVDNEYSDGGKAQGDAKKGETQKPSCPPSFRKAQCQIPQSFTFTPQSSLNECCLFRMHYSPSNLSVSSAKWCVSNQRTDSYFIVYFLLWKCYFRVNKSHGGMQENQDHNCLLNVSVCVYISLSRDYCFALLLSLSLILLIIFNDQ